MGAFDHKQAQQAFDRAVSDLAERGRTYLADAMVGVIDTHRILRRGLQSIVQREEVSDGTLSDLTQLVLTLEDRARAQHRARMDTTISSIVDTAMEATQEVHDQLVKRGLDVSWTPALVDSVLRHQSRARTRFDSAATRARNDESDEDLF